MLKFKQQGGGELDVVMTLMEADGTLKVTPESERQQPEQNRQEEDVANAGLTLYQSRTRSAGARYRLSPGFRSNAA